MIGRSSDALAVRLFGLTSRRFCSSLKYRDPKYRRDTSLNPGLALLMDKDPKPLTLKARETYKAIPTWDLIVNWSVYELLKYPSAIKFLGYMLSDVEKLQKNKFAFGLIKGSMGRVYSGGETFEETIPLVKRLNKQNISPGWDYAQETENGSETLFDNTLSYKKKSLDAAAIYDSNSCYAVKCSGLGNSVSLENVSKIVSEFSSAFQSVADNGEPFRNGSTTAPMLDWCPADAWVRNFKNPILTIEQMRNGYYKFLGLTEETASEELKKDIEEHIHRHAEDGKVDFYYYFRTLRLSEWIEKFAYKRVVNPVDQVDGQKMISMYNRIQTAIEYSGAHKIKIWMDAEWVDINPITDWVMIEFQSRYNVDWPHIYATYQGYLRGSEERCFADLEVIRRSGAYGAVKLVKGAYLTKESQIRDRNSPIFPVHSSFDRTEENYIDVVNSVILQQYECSKANLKVPALFLGVHSEAVVQHAVGLHNKAKEAGVPIVIGFGTLRGMSDALSIACADYGLNVHKLVPYGPMSSILPYLLRRAYDNSGTMGKERVATERNMLRRALFERLSPVSAVLSSFALGVYLWA